MYIAIYFDVTHFSRRSLTQVQSGMGLTGKFWAHQYYDVVPDIIVFGKKSQGTYLHHLPFYTLFPSLFFPSTPPPPLRVIYTAGDETD